MNNTVSVIASNNIQKLTKNFCISFLILSIIALLIPICLFIWQITLIDKVSETFPVYISSIALAGFALLWIVIIGAVAISTKTNLNILLRNKRILLGTLLMITTLVIAGSMIGLHFIPDKQTWYWYTSIILLSIAILFIIILFVSFIINDISDLEEKLKLNRNVRFGRSSSIKML